MNRPPCWPADQPCPNACAAALHERITYGKTPLYGPWAGWRLGGQQEEPGRLVMLPARERFAGSA